MNQEALNLITVERINNKIQNGQSAAIKHLQRALSDAASIDDQIVSIGSHKNDLSFKYTDSLSVYVGEDNLYDINKHALLQYATKVGIPTAYIASLLTAGDPHKMLAANILNEHAKFNPHARLLIRSINNNIKGILSDRYKRLDSVMILNSFGESAVKRGAVVVDGFYSETKVFLEMILPKPIIIDTPKNGLVSLAFGARISTSDYGDGKLELRSFMLNGVCLNGMVRESVMDKIHLGKQIDSSMLLSNKTYQLESQAASSAVNDFTSSILNTEYLRNKMEEVYIASSTSIDMEKEITVLQKSSKITKEEQHGILSLLLTNNPEDGIQGESTVWKLQQGITAFARDSSEVRERELQEIAGDLTNKYNGKNREAN